MNKRPKLGSRSCGLNDRTWVIIHAWQRLMPSVWQRGRDVVHLIMVGWRLASERAVEVEHRQRGRRGFASEDESGRHWPARGGVSIGAGDCGDVDLPASSGVLAQVDERQGDAADERRGD